MNTYKKAAGFTLIEISIVLIIIALVIGGILVGQDLISAAAARAQLTQIERYNAAVNTFRNKYGELPGDMDAQTASMFGFTTRATTGVSPTTSCPYPNSGLGDNNGLIQGFTAWWCNGIQESGGETLVFWEDLSKANLIDSNFTGLTNSSTQINYPGITLNQYFPAAKIGNGNSVYVWSGGWSQKDSYNYFGVTVISMIGNSNAWGTMSATAGMTPAQANAIDSKADDGLPQYGNILALQIGGGPAGFIEWAGAPTNSNYAATSFQSGMGDSETSNGSAPVQAGDGIYTPPHNTGGQPTTCYDNNSQGGVEHYSLKNAQDLNCALSFKFQ